MLLVRDEEEAATRKEEQQRRRTERERAKARQAQDATGNILDDADDQREERHSGTVGQLSFLYVNHTHSTIQVYISYSSLKTLKFSSSYQKGSSELCSHHGMCAIF